LEARLSYPARRGLLWACVQFLGELDEQGRARFAGSNEVRCGQQHELSE